MKKAQKKALTEIKELALAYLSETTPVKKFGILLKVEKYFESLSFKTSGKLLAELGLSYFSGVNSSQKVEKGKKENYDTLVLYLSAGKNAGKDVCEFASTGCRLACLVASGHALIEKYSGKHVIDVSRIVKTWLVIYRKDLAVEVLKHEIKLASARAERKGHKFAARLNGTSDLDFSEIYLAFPDIQFYDYTKNPNREPLPNYHVTFSYSQGTKTRVKHYKQAIARGQSIAIPVRASDFEQACDLPDCYSMDKTDLRFLDGEGKYGILKAKVTENLNEGIKEKFILSLEELKQVIELIEA
jgi:hypothetical protein